MFFSQQLDLLQALCDSKGWKTAISTGKLAQHKNDEAIKKWESEENRPILLMSMKAGGTGLNLTSATRVIITDLWWNLSTEMQAATRAHRIGQQHDVEVTRILVKGGYDDDLVRLQTRKDVQIKSVMSGKAGLAVEFDLQLSFSDFDQSINLEPAVAHNLFEHFVLLID